MKLVGYGYLDKDSAVDVRLKDRWQRVYFKDLKESEDDDADAEAIRKANALKTEAKALEEERLKVLEQVLRNKKVLE